MSRGLRYAQLIFIILFLSPVSSQAEQRGSSRFDLSLNLCQHYLAFEGFENIQMVIDEHQTLWIAYENRRYRNEVTALGIVLRYAMECIPAAERFVVIPKFRDIPIIYIDLDRDRLYQFLKDEKNREQFIDHFNISCRAPDDIPGLGHTSSSSFYKLDLNLYPGVKTQFARPDDPVQLQLNVLNDISVTLARGMQFNGQWIIPFYNEFHNSEGKSRLGQCYVSQFLRLPSATFLFMSVGLFENQLFGSSTQLTQFFLRDKFDLSILFNYMRLTKESPFRGSCENHLAYVFQAQYHFDRVNFRTKLSWGRYTLGDESWRVDIVRTFDELELGFMGIWNRSMGFLTGMSVRLPFPVARYPYPHFARMRTPRFFDWNYRYLPFFDGYLPDTGLRFDEISGQFALSSMRSNIHDLKNVERFVKINIDPLHPPREKP